MMQGFSAPDKTNIIGEPMRRRADGERVKIDSGCYARKKYATVVNGAEIFAPDYWTAYA